MPCTHQGGLGQCHTLNSNFVFIILEVDTDEDDEDEDAPEDGYESLIKDRDAGELMDDRGPSAREIEGKLRYEQMIRCYYST